MLPFRDTELRSSADSLTYVSHSGRPAQAGRVPGGQRPDDRCQHDERLLERRRISSWEVSRIVTVAKAGHSGLRERLGMDLRDRQNGPIRAPPPGSRRAAAGG